MIVTIQMATPTCPECAEMLVKDKAVGTFHCRNCKNTYTIIGTGQTDREIRCKLIKETHDRT